MTRGRPIVTDAAKGGLLFIAPQRSINHPIFGTPEGCFEGESFPLRKAQSVFYHPFERGHPATPRMRLRRWRTCGGTAYSRSCGLLVAMLWQPRPSRRPRARTGFPILCSRRLICFEVGRAPGLGAPQAPHPLGGTWAAWAARRNVGSSASWKTVKKIPSFLIMMWTCPHH